MFISFLISYFIAMTSLTLTLNGTSSHLHAEYFPALDLSDGDYVCGLIDFQTFNSIPNIDETNNLFYIHFNEDLRQNIISKNKEIKIQSIRDLIKEKLGTKYFSLWPLEIPTGTYEITDIEKYLVKELNQYGIDLQLKANPNTLKCEMKCMGTVDFWQPGTIGELLGFESKCYGLNQFHESEFITKILKVNVIRIECDLIKGAYLNNKPSNTIHEFSPRVSPGYKINEVPKNVIYFPVTVKNISTLNISLVDQNGQPINFRGETITVRIHIKKV